MRKGGGGGGGKRRAGVSEGERKGGPQNANETQYEGKTERDLQTNKQNDKQTETKTNPTEKSTMQRPEGRRERERASSGGTIILQRAKDRIARSRRRFSATKPQAARRSGDE